jgi:hypothetical protein
MAQALASTPRFRLRLLGYDRREVSAALTATKHELERAVARRDELVVSTANVERIGAQVADVLRSLADRAVELEVEAAAEAAKVIEAAQVDAAKIRADAAAVLAAADATAQRMAEESRRQRAAIGERRETAVVSLQIAIDQMGRLATTIEEIDLTADDVPFAAATADDAATETKEAVILLPWSASASSDAGDEDATAAPADDPIAPALARLDHWAGSRL